VAQQKVTLEGFSRIAVPLPPVKEQMEIVRRASVLLELAQGTESELESVAGTGSRLRQSVLFSAFSGSLTRQEPSDEPASILIERLRSEHQIAFSGGRARKAALSIKPRRRKANTMEVTT
jgi:type I restriction enzyme, S subunit